MWIESHQSLLTHRKTGRLSRALGISKITAIGHLHAFWWWCMDNAKEGDLTGVEAEDIADGSCWEGDAAAFIEAMVHAGFVDRSETAVVIHDWMDYAGKLIEKRKSDAERKRQSRSRGGHPQDGGAPAEGHPEDVPGMSGGCPSDIPVTAPVPNLTVPNQPTVYDTGDSNPTFPPGKRGGEAVPSSPSPKVPVFLTRESKWPWLTEVHPNLSCHADRFEQEFYPAYPRKEAPSDAWKAWKRLIREWTPEMHVVIMASLEAHKASSQWQDKTKVPHPATWLNERRWEGEPPDESASGAAGGNLAPKAPRPTHEEALQNVRNDLRSALNGGDGF